jgi:hypothetical protein
VAENENVLPIERGNERKWMHPDNEEAIVSGYRGFMHAQLGCAKEA